MIEKEKAFFYWTNIKKTRVLLILFILKFRSFDKDPKGRITTDEIRFVLQHVGIDQNEIDEIILHFDNDNDGIF